MLFKAILYFKFSIKHNQMKKNQLKISVIVSILSLLLFNDAVHAQADAGDTSSGKTEYLDGHPCIPYMLPPSNLTADSITSSSAQLHATVYGGGGVVLYYKLPAAQAWTFAPGGIAKPLLANTQYQFYAIASRDVCGKVITKSSAIADFTTLAAAGHSLLSMNLYPNPGRGSGLLSFKLPESGNVIIELFDNMGRPVKTSDKGTMPEGDHQIVFSMENERVAPGLYFVRITTSFGATEIIKIIVIK
jgi:hypothetical protein